MARHNTFTQEEEKFLIENYSSMAWDELIDGISRICNRPRKKQAIISKAFCLGLRRSSARNGCFTEEEKRLIEEVYTTSTEQSLTDNINRLISTKMPHRTFGSIQTWASNHGLRMREPWTDNDITFLRDNYFTMFTEDIAKAINRTPTAVYNMVRKLGLKGAPRSLYSKEDIEFVRDNYLQMSDGEIGKVLHRAGNSIKELRIKNGLPRPRPEDVFYGFEIYTHRHNVEWKKASAKNCGYKCVITGEHFDDIHHLFSRNSIIEEVLEDNPEYKSINFNDLKDNEKEDAMAKFIEAQSKHPLGVCLRKDFHIMFHKKYGYGDNTPEQFYQFVKEVAPDRLSFIMTL